MEISVPEISSSRVSNMKSSCMALKGSNLGGFCPQIANLRWSIAQVIRKTVQQASKGQQQQGDCLDSWLAGLFS
jgi:hypothetical protein